MSRELCFQSGAGTGDGAGCVCQPSPCSGAALCLCADRMKMMEHRLPPFFRHRDPADLKHLFVSVGSDKIWIKIVNE